MCSIKLSITSFPEITLMNHHQIGIFCLKHWSLTDSHFTQENLNFPYCHFSIKYFEICTVDCFLAGLESWGGMRFCFFVFLKATTENPFVCTVPLLPLSWNQNLHMKHFKCSLNKHKWNPYNELCLETHEICTILIIFLEQMDLKIALKTLIKKVWLR